MTSTKLILSRLRRDDSYPMRYASLVDAIPHLTSTRWDEGTSVWIIHHQSSAVELLSVLLTNTSVYIDGTDMLVVADLNTREVAQVGVDDPTKLNFVLQAGNPGRPGALGGLFALGNAPGLGRLR